MENRNPIKGRAGTDNPVPPYYLKSFGFKEIKEMITDFEEMLSKNDAQGLMYRYHFLSQSSLTSDKFDSGVKWCLSIVAEIYIDFMIGRENK